MRVALILGVLLILAVNVAAVAPATVIRPSQPIDHGCCLTMVPAILQATWPNGLMTAISNTFAARLIIR